MMCKMGFLDLKYHIILLLDFLLPSEEINLSNILNEIKLLIYSYRHWNISNINCISLNINYKLNSFFNNSLPFNTSSNNSLHLNTSSFNNSLPFNTSSNNSSFNNSPNFNNSHNLISRNKLQCQNYSPA